MFSRIFKAMGMMLLVASATGCSGQQEIVDPQLDSIDRLASDCECFVQSGQFLIPDGNAEGTTLGPLLLTDDGESIHEIVLALDIVHPWTGDLDVMLWYDVDSDGQFEAGTHIDFHLARTGSWENDPWYAVPLPLSGVYYFCDEADEIDFEPERCPEITAFDPTMDLTCHAFSVFEGLPKGGSFYLTVVDTLAGKPGLVRGWAIHSQHSDANLPSAEVGS